jgi:hypothetical protein
MINSWIFPLYSITTSPFTYRYLFEIFPSTI